MINPRNIRSILLGRSPQILECLRKIEKAARTDATVLITGETGTGKELVAQTLLEQSDRASGPYVAVNCGAISEELVENELFGHEKGSFTGADRQTKGKFEQAHGGTLFLDEIGEMRKSTQVKLLRVLEERVVDRVGGERPIPVDVRIVAGTHVDLKEAVRKNKFREDLYYRLNVVKVNIPPLRERGDDISLLAHHFALVFRKAGLSQELLDLFMKHSWPGNVRELRALIQASVINCEADVIGVADLPDDFEVIETPAGKKTGTYDQEMQRFEKSLIARNLRRARGDYRKAAENLAIHPKTVHRKISEFGLNYLLSEKRKANDPENQAASPEQMDEANKTETVHQTESESSNSVPGSTRKRGGLEIWK